MEITAYNVDEFIKYFQDDESRSEVQKRLESYGFEINTVLTWDEEQHGVSEWFSENRHTMKGRIIWSYSRQAEFECYEDALSFKLRWEGNN